MPCMDTLSQTNNSTTVDLAIIGAGPVGLFASFYAGLRQMSVKLIDSLDALGGQLITLYPEKYVYDVAGFPRVLAKDLADHLIKQGTQYGAISCMGEQVRTLEFDEASRTFAPTTSKAVHPARDDSHRGGGRVVSAEAPAVARTPTNSKAAGCTIS